MGVYISELDIETYRGIKKLKMENLAPINIITGDNNSGKTSVLASECEKSDKLSGMEKPN